MKKLLAIFVAAFELLAVLLPTVSPVDVEATVSVEGICDLDVDTTPLAFGALDEGDISGVLTRDVDLDANTPTDVDILGTTWVGTDPSNTMSVGRTVYDLDDDTTPTTQLSTSATTLFSSSVDASHFVGFQVTIPDPQPADTYSQTITITSEC